MSKYTVDRSILSSLCTISIKVSDEALGRCQTAQQVRALLESTAASVIDELVRKWQECQERR